MSNESPAAIMGIMDREIAVPFNLHCADTLHAWELEQEYEREKRQLELMTGQSLSGALGGGQGQSNNAVERW